jgi:putative ABC transport system permease protein
LSRAIGSPLPALRGMTGTLARENAGRNPRRTASTAAALMIGVALVSFITIFASSAKHTLDTQIDRAFRADFVISGGGFGFGGFSPELGRDLRELPEVSNASGLRFNRVEIDRSSEFLVALEPDAVNALFDLDPRRGRLEDLGPGGLAISQRVADDEGWRVGTTVPVRFPTGPRDLTVVAVYAVGQREGLTDYAISLSAYEEGYTEQLDNQVYVNLADGVSGDEGAVALERVVEGYPTAEVLDVVEFKEQIAGQITQILNLVYALLGLAVFIALIGIANTLALSVYERTRELGLLRAVGMTRRQLRSSVRWESVIIALLGTAMGIVIGLFFAWAVVQALEEEGITEFTAPAGQLLVVVIVAAVAGVLAALGPARRAARLDVLRAISEE